ncbi:DNA gyrase inhibitor [Paenibacillus sp. PK3_47]|uniref:AraC family transcriptional regulator n=1 Tax=Paenibacillus sp. PK3_47 TaxID=2072642 RepID=UPI00201E02E0|nr:GyrI-like domain-containing protein [Paenibacillus sp. PK3_47]UQZ35610.1 DNA gyrase inhibitor [Paenibacillus sp. PK3_47]
MNIKIETLPKTRIAYVRQTGPYGPGNIQAMNKLKQWAGERQLLTESAILFGIPQDHPEMTPPEQCRYDACIVIPDDYGVDSSIPESEFSGGEYLVCKIRHTAEDVQKAWAEMIPAVQSRGYRIANKPIIERYTGEMILSEMCELCVPVEPVERSDYHS